VQALAGLEITLELGVEAIRAHNLRQTKFIKERLPVEGSGPDYGAFVTLKRANAVSLSEKLKAKGIETDARGEYLRLCPDYLTSAAELARAVAVLEEELLHPA
jgi:kynureninase